MIADSTRPVTHGRKCAISLVEPDTMCNLCKSYVTTICKWYVDIYIIFDIEALFRAYVIRMPHVYILKGIAMFYLVK